MKVPSQKLLLLWKKLIQSYADYRVTVTAVALLSAYEAFHTFLDIFDYDVRKQMYVWQCFIYAPDVDRFMALFICAAMLLESGLPYTKKEKRVKAVRISGFFAAAVIAGTAAWGMALGESAQVFHVPGSVVSRWTEQFAVGYVLLLLLGTVCFCHRKSGVGFIEYMLHVLVNWCVTTAVFLVVSIGTAMVLSVVDALFFDSYGVLGDTGLILVTGLYYVPGCIMALQNTDSNIETQLGRVLIRYVLTGMTICALMTVYVYLLRNLIIWEMPSNELFGIVTGLFCFGMPIWVMDYYYRDETKYMRFLERLPYGLLPLIPVQIYAMGVRIYEYGMTPGRYMGVAMVIFEIAVLVIWRFRKDKMEYVLVFSGACVIIIFLVPGMNRNSLSDRWQQTFLETYYQKLLTQGSLTQIERQRLQGAYDYLKSRPEMASVLEQHNIYEESFAERLAETGMDMETYTQIESHQIHCRPMVDSLDVGGFSRLYVVNEDAGYHVTEEKIPVDFTAFRLCKQDDDNTENCIIVDLSDFADRCMAYEKEHRSAWASELCEAMKPYNRIALDDGSMLYIDEFHVRYEEGIKYGEAYFEIESVDVSGMLLEKAENPFGMSLKENTALLVTVEK